MLRQAFRANLLPAVVLWSFAGLLLLLYHFHAPTHQALNGLAAFKARLGLGFSMPAQALAAGFLPWVFQSFQRGPHRRTRLSHVPFLMLVFACLGAMSDGFYRLQALVFGDSSQPGVVLSKVAVDMLLYAPFIITPIVVWTFALKDSGFRLDAARQLMGQGWFARRVFPVYVAALVVWIPTLCVVYALPLALQFPFQAIVQCFWGLILVIMTDKRTAEAVK